MTSESVDEAGASGGTSSVGRLMLTTSRRHHCAILSCLPRNWPPLRATASSSCTASFHPPVYATALERVTPAHRRASTCLIEPWADSSGAAVKAPDGSDHPIPLTCADARWPALFEAPALRAILDQLHGGPSSWSWAYGAADGLGWCRAPRPSPPSRQRRLPSRCPHC